MSDLLGGLRWAEGIRQRGDGTKTTNDFCVLALADEVISLRKYAREIETKLSLYAAAEAFLAAQPAQKQGEPK